MAFNHGHRWPLRTRLLAGTTSVVLVGFGATKALADADKWQPYIELGVRGGDDRVIGGVEMFVPIWQDMDSLLFGDLRGRFDDNEQEEFNLGLGYRTRMNSDWLIGAYGFWDHKNSEWDNEFDEFNAGLEILSEDWDLRANAYFAEDDVKPVPFLTSVHVSNGTIQIFTGAEAALSGFDAEVGYRIFSGETFETRLFVGGFHFDHDLFEDVEGPRARVEARIFDLDFLGPQSRLTLLAEVQDDDVRDTTAFAGVHLRVPLQFDGEAPSLEGLDRRFVDAPVRDLDIVTVATDDVPSYSEDVHVYGTEQGYTGVIRYIDQTGGGPGTYEDPASDVQGTFDGAGEDAIIVALSKTGDIDHPEAGIVLPDGQVLVGGGTTVTLVGEDTGTKIDFTFQGDSGTFIGHNAEGHMIELGNYDTIWNVGFDGDFFSAIYGYNTPNALIREIRVDGGADGPFGYGYGGPMQIGEGGGSFGVYLYNYNAGSTTVTVEDSDFANLYGVGVYSRTIVFDEASSTQNLTVTGSTFANIEGDGIDSENFVAEGANFTQTLTFSGNNFDGIGNDAIAVGWFLDEYSYFDGSNTLTIDENVITDVGGDGVDIDTFVANSDANIEMDFDGNSISKTGDSGLEVATGVYGDSDVAMSLHGGPTDITGAHGDAVEVTTYATGAEGDTTYVYQALLLSDLDIDATTADGEGGGGASFVAEANGEGTTIVQYAALDGGSVTNTGEGSEHSYFKDTGAILAAALVTGEGTVIQSLGVTDFDVTDNLYTGILAAAFAEGGEIDQFVYIDPTTSSDNGNYGVRIIAEARPGEGPTSVYQNAHIDDLTADYNYIGLGISGYATYFTSVVQVAEGDGNSFTGNFLGINIEAYAYLYGSVQQYTNFTNTTIDGQASLILAGGEGGYGLFVAADADEGGGITQNLNFYGGSITYTAADFGFFSDYLTAASVNAFVAEGGVLTQTVTLSDMDVTDNQGTGVYIGGFSAEGGNLGQTVNLAGGTDVSRNGETGVAFFEFVAEGGNLSFDLNVTDSTITNNAEVGIFGEGTASSFEADLYIDVDVANSDISYNPLGGIDVNANGTYLGDHVTHYLSIVNSTITNAAEGTGVEFDTFVTGGASGEGGLYIDPSSVSDNAYGGVEMTAYSATGSSNLYMDVTILGAEGDPSQFNNNGEGAGIGIYASSFNGSHTELDIYIRDIEANYNENGLVLDAYSYQSDVTTVMYATVRNGTFNGNDEDGVYVLTEARYNGHSVTDASFYNITANYNGDAGMQFTVVETSGGDADQYIFVDPSAMTGNAVGVEIDAYSSNTGEGGLQIVTLQEVDVSGNQFAGIEVDATVTDGGYFALGVYLDNVTADNTAEGDGFNADLNASEGGFLYAGIFVDAEGSLAPTSLDAGALLVEGGSSFSNNYGDGLHVQLDVGDSSSMTAGVIVGEGGNFNANGDDGLEMNASVGEGVLLAVVSAQANNNFNENGGDGLNMDIAVGPGGIEGSALVLGEGSSFSDNDGAGITQSVDLFAAEGFSILLAEGISVSGNAEGGLSQDLEATYGSELYSVSYVTGSQFYENGGSTGAHFDAYAAFGGVVYSDLFLGGNTFYGNADSGLEIHNYATAEGVIIENFDILANQFTYNENYGALISNESHGGSYILAEGSLLDNTAGQNDVGFGFANYAPDTGGSILDVQLDDNTSNSNGFAGFSFDNYGEGAFMDAEGSGNEANFEHIGFYAYNGDYGFQHICLADTAFLLNIDPQQVVNDGTGTQDVEISTQPSPDCAVPPAP